MKTLQKAITDHTSKPFYGSTKVVILILTFTIATSLLFASCSNKLISKDDCDSCPKRGETYNGNPFKKRK